MKNYIQEGKTLTVTAISDVASGGGVLIGSLFGVAIGSAASGSSVTISRSGVFSLPKVEAQAWTVGDQIFWDDGDTTCTTASEGNVLIGLAVAAAANPTTTGTVALVGCPVMA